MTTLTDTPPLAAAPEHARWFADARRILDVTEVTPGLPLPSIGATLAAFNFTGITHAREAAEAVALAETVLSYALKTDFTPRPVPRIGSSAHYILSAYMPSGLRVDIVARAGIFDSLPAPAAREDEAEMAVA
jgi:hypothetical protein